MSSVEILTVYLLLFGVYVTWDTILEFINISHLRKNANSIPQIFAAYIDPASYFQSTKYTEAKTKFSVCSNLFSSVVLFAVILTGALGIFDAWIVALHLGQYSHGVVFVVGISLLLSLIDIPFALYRTFVIEEKFGFNKMTLGLWLIDLLKGTLLSLAIMVPLLYALLWFMHASGSLWWLYAATFLFLVQLVLVYIYPVLISPLFNKFTALPEGSLRKNILALAEKVGFSASEIFVMDGSKRSAHGNAYFTGLGRNKRIVLFDTLVSDLSEPQTVAVLAHEIGHEKKQHIKKSMLLSILLSYFGFWIVSLLIDYGPLFAAFGFKTPSNHAALVIFAFASSPLTYFLSPLVSGLSRRFEYEADRFAVDAVAGFSELRDALICLSKKSLSNLTPHPLYSFFHYAHPTLAERIAAMERYSATRNS